MNSVKALTLSLALSCGLVSASHAQEGRGDVVYVPTPQIVVDEMLKMAKVGPKDYLIDLGSGDGRIIITAAKQYGARGFGVDLDTYLLSEANKNARNEGVADRAQFYERNIFETKLDSATVITSYLLPQMNLKLRPTILNLQPGVRVVGHDYHMGEWLPDEQKTIPVPEKQVGTPGVSYIYLWYVPAKIAGTWQSRINTGQGEVPYEFSLEQTFQEIAGVMRAGRDTAKFNSKVQGDRVSFVALPKIGDKTVRHEFNGRIKGDRIEGTVKIGEGATARQANWVARQTQRREPRKPADDVGA
ncbi:MAG: SAM-dependent methyltransferase [Rhodospirillaceae bacterium]